MEETMIVSEVVDETLVSKLILEVDKCTQMIRIRSTFSGHSDTVVCVYMNELEKLVETARKLIK